MNIQKRIPLNTTKSRQFPAETGIFLALALMVVTFSLINEYFFTLTNFSNILVQSAITIVVASGATIVIATGGIDLSVGSVLCISGIMMAKSMAAGYSIGFSILIGFLTSNHFSNPK